MMKAIGSFLIIKKVIETHWQDVQPPACPPPEPAVPGSSKEWKSEE